MSDEEMKAELERLRNENAALKKGVTSGIRMKVSEKGAGSDLRYGQISCDLIQRTVGEGYFIWRPTFVRSLRRTRAKLKAKA